MALEREIAAYQANLMELLQHEGRFVVIHGDEPRGVWDTYEEALAFGYEQFGLEPFLVKQIRPAEPIQYFSRDLPQCPS
jgi:hypothetical protein